MARARGPGARRAASLLRAAWSWRERRYDLAINFEPDVRSNLLAAASGAARTAGWTSGGGGPVLDLALDYDTTAHTSGNARRLVRDGVRPAPLRVSTQPLLDIPDAAVAAAATILARGASAGRSSACTSAAAAPSSSGSRSDSPRSRRRLADAARRHDRRDRDRRQIARSSTRCSAALAPRIVIDASRADDLAGSGRDPRSARCARHRRHRADAPGVGGRHAGRRRLRPVRSRALRDARPLDRVVRIDLALQPLQPHPAAAGAMRRPYAGLPGAASSSDAVFEAALSVLDRTRPRLTDAPVAHDRRGLRPATPAIDVARFAWTTTSMRPPKNGRRSKRIAWIKGLRHARVDGVTLRRRFTVRGDSLWWFAELYLHKQQVILSTLRDRSRRSKRSSTREQPRSCNSISGSRLVRGLAPRFAAARCVDYTRPARGSAVRQLCVWPPWRRGRAALNAAALASRLRMRGAARPRLTPDGRWRSSIGRSGARDAGDGSAEAYIGPVLAALEARLGAAVAYVSVGPASNFRARRWWHPLPRQRARRESVTADRGVSRRSPHSPSHAASGENATGRAGRSGRAPTCAPRVIRGCDCWPVVREELAGIALLQWPWSARAMDEAGAALDALGPRSS